ncbi:hypothetical protein [Roseateles depolymerans]|uniref:Uncharacterized protein n=1 Tax=Roseateles depolymerans TaxID=76731 RepID=A0A0U3LGU4_9BURK|nr:hypothetical protein [Roseateles depolymerans]ALV07311.1 hypothetical protein RD2015_2847 [Roseateles depolymerans]REG20295.1 hypothetical protein DES44_2803 [Roseateles depolymerans]
MELDDKQISAIITGLTGIAGVILGNSFVAIKEALTGHFKKKKDAGYLAIVTVSHLEKLALGCYAVGCDDGTELGEPAGGNGFYAATVDYPSFSPLALDVEWKAIPQELMYEIFRLPDEIEQVRTKLGIIYENDSRPDFPEYFKTRREEFIRIGLEIADLIDRLRSVANLPPERVRLGEYSIRARMEWALQQRSQEEVDLAKRNQERKTRQAAERLTAEKGQKGPEIPGAPIED